jgi:DDE superfamily endonuclease
MTAERCVGWADEMRLGLMGTTRRVWGRRGVKVQQRLQLVREWRYLHLVVDPRGGRLWWCWSQTMQAMVARTVVEATKTETDLSALVWDRAPSHCNGMVRALGLPLVEQPPYAPELNPVERVFEYLRAEIEGVVYPTIEAKVAAVEAVLDVLDADPDRVQRLTNWHWIADSLDHLPHNNAA